MERTNAVNQLALVDVLADEAIQRAHDHNPLWVSTAVGYILYLKIGGNPFTSDDVWARMEGVPPSTDPRAMGAAFRQAALDGWIKPTGRYVKSTRAACHGRMIREWISVHATIQPLGNGCDAGEAHIVSPTG